MCFGGCEIWFPWMAPPSYLSILMGFWRLVGSLAELVSSADATRRGSVWGYPLHGHPSIAHDLFATPYDISGYLVGGFSRRALLIG